MCLCENCISILCGVYVCVCLFVCVRACVHVCVKKNNADLCVQSCMGHSKNTCALFTLTHGHVRTQTHTHTLNPNPKPNPNPLPDPDPNPNQPSRPVYLGFHPAHNLTLTPTPSLAPTLHHHPQCQTLPKHNPTQSPTLL